MSSVRCSQCQPNPQTPALPDRTRQDSGARCNSHPSDVVSSNSRPLKRSGASRGSVGDGRSRVLAADSGAKAHPPGPGPFLSFDPVLTRASRPRARACVVPTARHSTHRGGGQLLACFLQYSTVPDAYLTVSGLGEAESCSSFCSSPGFLPASSAKEPSLDRLYRPATA